MNKLTEKQKKFALGIKSGLNYTKACINAGYSEKSARRIGSTLMKHPGIKKILEGVDIKQQQETRKETIKVIEAMERIDPLDYLLSVVEDPAADPKLRADCAKSILPYTHGKVADVGKKESQEAKAKGLQENRFQTLKVPKYEATKLQ